jgi:hypothetical protein
VLAFTTGAALLSSVMFGLAPALRAGGIDPLATLRAAGPAPLSRRRAGATDPFVIAQIAMSMALVVGAALLVRTLLNLERAPLGFDQDLLGVHRGSHKVGDSGGVRKSAPVVNALRMRRTKSGTAPGSVASSATHSGRPEEET